MNIFAETFLICNMKELLDKKLEQYGAKQINTKHKAVIEFAVVVPRINTDSKYCTAGRAQTRFSELSSVAECPCSIPVRPQAQKKHSNSSRQIRKRSVQVQTHRPKYTSNHIGRFKYIDH